MTTENRITAEVLAGLRSGYLADEKARVVRNALTRNDIAAISRRLEAEADNANLFSIDLETMPATNQLRSGRCWIFSAMNVLREKIAKKYQIKEFELSQNYVAFYDKLEKCNWFMECVLQELDAPAGDGRLRFLLDMAVSDGGQWNMIQNLVAKYGICPKTAMPETYQSSHTHAMNGILNKRLRRFAADSRRAHRHNDPEKIEQLREECLKECYGLISSCFGLPPQTFAFEYRDTDKEWHAEYNLTPKAFYEKYLAEDLEEYVNVIHGPTHDKPYWHTYTVRYLGNVVGGTPVKMLNLPLEEMKEAILAQLKDGEPVWFGCDAGKYCDRETGLWDDIQFDYEATFDMHLEMSKADQLDMRESAMNHAMVFTGVNLKDGRPTRWKIENSWGDKTANKGYFICSDSWFDRYVFTAAVPKKYLSEKARKAFEEEPAVLDPWDPFGTLAD